MKKKAPRVLILESRYYEEVADQLLAGASAVLESGGASIERITVPGVFEIPAALALAVRTRRFDGFVALGCVIRGETDHYDHICRESSRALMSLAVDRGLALGFGVLTCATREQAVERAAVDRKNKGAEAARACLRMIELKRRLDRPRRR
ncbi:MAG: 6,7-dimethyl-8-ribityllumazine synthase [Rhodospirillales bacterium]|nr:6,7-dimethyl-8-ribityllumazine synthase [Rhodospirillales bacterium]